MNRTTSSLVLALLLCLLSVDVTPACTNFLITRGATVDGSTMITYAADAHVLYGELYFTPAGRHAPGTLLDVYEWDTGKRLGQIAQAPETYTVVGNMNEHQVSIGETTWGGRSELHDPEALVDYGSLMYIALQRAKTAREAIEIMTDLVAEYGYYSSGESFSIADPEEVWLLELIGKGPDNKGAVWVARKVPDGYITAHANAPRIRQFPQDDPKNTIFAPDVISFARDKGWFDGSDEEFSFAETYSPDDFGAVRFCDSRVWCMYNRARPSDKIPADWVLGQDGAEPLPLWIKPDKKLTVGDVAGFMRDHFEGTELDMTKDIGAGPYEVPYRWRPLTWDTGDEEKKFFNERATSTQQTGFSFVAQARSWLPDPIGGVLWFGVDDTFSTVYFPVYCGVTEVPYNFRVGTGSFDEFNWDSAFWVFNWVSNYAYSRYSEMIQDIQVVQRELESGFLADQDGIDAAAQVLYEQSPRLARDYLTAYTNETAATVHERWKKLGEFLLWRYLDGNLKDEHGTVTHPGYPKSWYEKVAATTGEHLAMRKLEAEQRRSDAEEQADREQAARLSESILALLKVRGIDLDKETRGKIEDADDPAQLEVWLVNAATAETADEVTAGEPVGDTGGH
ncbi:MAG: dipeptidase [bacterium]|nr:dipeptidase [bacterium]